MEARWSTTGTCSSIRTMQRIHARGFWSMHSTWCACTSIGDKDADAKEGTPANKLPSFVAMSQLARNDEKVSGLMIQERYEQAQEAFKGAGPQEDAIELDWVKHLTVDGSNPDRKDHKQCRAGAGK